jgi:hypothetical protein
MSDLAITNSFDAGDAIVASEMNTNFGNITTWANGAPNIGVSGSTATMDGALTVTEALIASSTSQFNGTVTLGVDDTGVDLICYGAATGAYMKWNQATDDLQLVGAAGLDIAGDIDVDGTANFDVVDIDGACDMASTLSVAGNLTVGGSIDGPSSFYVGNGEGEQAYFANDSNQTFFQSNGTWRAYFTAAGHFQPYTNDAYNVGVEGGRWDTIYATDGTINTSDERDKTNVADLDLGLPFINALRPISYTWDMRSGRVGTRTHMGFSAQEVATVLGDQAADRAVWSDAPAGENINVEGEAVPYDACQGLRYHELIAPLVKSVQELTTRLEALEAA